MTKSMRALVEARERHRRWLDAVRPSSASGGLATNADREGERLARELADSVLTDEARQWLEHRVRSKARSRVIGALQFCSGSALGWVADWPAADDVAKRACPISEAPTFEVERSLDVFTALALAADRLADDADSTGDSAG